MEGSNPVIVLNSGLSGHDNIADIAARSGVANKTATKCSGSIRKTGRSLIKFGQRLKNHFGVPADRT